MCFGCAGFSRGLIGGDEGGEIKFSGCNTSMLKFVFEFEVSLRFECEVEYRFTFCFEGTTSGMERTGSHHSG